MKRWYRFATATFLALGLAALLPVGGSSRPEAAETVPASEGKGQADLPFKPVAPLDVLMEKIDDSFLEFGPRVSEEGGKKITSKDLKKFKKEATFLSELFNVAHHHKKEKDFAEWAVATRDQFLAFASGCDKGDVKALKATFDAIEKTCTACHEKYRDKEG